MNRGASLDDHVLGDERWQPHFRPHRPESRDNDNYLRKTSLEPGIFRPVHAPNTSTEAEPANLNRYRDSSVRRIKAVAARPAR